MTGLLHLLNWMRPAASAYFLGALVTVLAVGALACPLWTGPSSDCAMPCPEQSGIVPHECPWTICLASESYPIPPASAAVPLPDALPVAALVSTLASSPLAGPHDTLQLDGAPPGSPAPIFLRIHSLLI